MLKNTGERIREWVERAKLDRRPVMSWAAGALEEIYFDGDFEKTRVMGSSQLVDYDPTAIRIVAFHDTSISALSLTPFPPDYEEPLNTHAHSPLSLAQSLRDEVDCLRLRPNPHEATITDIMQASLKIENKKVLAALELGETVGDRESVSHVFYPRTYIRTAVEVLGNLGIKTNPQLLRVVCYEVALTFLKRRQPVSEKIFDVGQG